MNNLNHLENLVRTWSQSRGIYEHCPVKTCEFHGKGAY